MKAANDNPPVHYAKVDLHRSRIVSTVPVTTLTCCGWRVKSELTAFGEESVTCAGCREVINAFNRKAWAAAAAQP